MLTLCHHISWLSAPPCKPIQRRATYSKCSVHTRASGAHKCNHCVSIWVHRYAHVVPKCLEDSPTNKWWQEYYKSGGKQSDLAVHIEQAAE